MTDDMRELPWPLNQESATQYVADHLGIEATELTYTGKSLAGSYGFRYAGGKQATLHTPKGRKSGVIITS